MPRLQIFAPAWCCTVWYLVVPFAHFSGQSACHYSFSHFTATDQRKKGSQKWQITHQTEIAKYTSNEGMYWRDQYDLLKRRVKRLHGSDLRVLFEYSTYIGTYHWHLEMSMRGVRLLWGGHWSLLFVMFQSPIMRQKCWIRGWAVEILQKCKQK